MMTDGRGVRWLTGTGTPTLPPLDSAQLSLSEPEPRSLALAPTLERSPQQAADQSPDKKSRINGEQFAEESLKLRTFNDQKY